MINTDKTINGQAISYELFSDGYEIYLDGVLWIKQRGEYGKPIDSAKSFEENCLAQIEELTRPVEEPNNDYGVPNEVYNNIIDDYTLQLIEEGAIA